MFVAEIEELIVRGEVMILSDQGVGIRRGKFNKLWRLL